MDDVFGQMDRMMNQMMGNMGMFNDPFGMNSFGMRRPGMNSSPFSMMPMIMNPMAMQNMSASNNSPGTFMSSIVSFSSNGVNPPQVYEQTHSNRVGPGGVREERRSVRDSRTGLQQMSIGRHINERGHVIERSKNRYTGEEEESNEYVNIEEEEAPQFNQEWSSRMGGGSSSHHHHHHRHIQAPRREPVLAITAGPEESNVHFSQPSTSGASDYRNSSHKKLRIKPTSMKKKEMDKKSKSKPYRKE